LKFQKWKERRHESIGKGKKQKGYQSEHPGDGESGSSTETGGSCGTSYCWREEENEEKDKKEIMAMTGKYSTKSVLVIDCGLFVELAVTLSKSFGKVWYYSPWTSAFPKSNQRLVGDGIPGVMRCNNPWDILDEVDLFVFPDVYEGPLQVYLDSKGKRVWGSRKGENLELYRDWSKEYMSKAGLDIGKYEVAVGMDALRKMLKARPNVWVKINITRGDMESFYSKNYNLIEPRLDELEYSLGAKKDKMEFFVEDSIDDAVEVGYDGYCVDGQFPSIAMWGLEIKDRGYVGFVTKDTRQPLQITDTNQKLSSILKKFKYRNFFSTEMRVTKDGTAYPIDVCARLSSPPGELIQAMYENLPDIIWNGAEGKLVEPLIAGKFGVEVMIHSSWADKNWEAVQFPKSIRDNVKFRNLTIINNKYYVVPQAVGLPEIGAVVAVGNTLEDAVAKAREYCKQVEGYFITCCVESLDEAETEMAKLKSYLTMRKEIIKQAAKPTRSFGLQQAI